MKKHFIRFINQYTSAIYNPESSRKINTDYKSIERIENRQFTPEADKTKTLKAFYRISSIDNRNFKNPFNPFQNQLMITIYAEGI